MYNMSQNQLFYIQRRNYTPGRSFMKEDKKQPRGIRVTEETWNKFRLLTDDLGGDQQQALAKIMEVYELEKGKEILPDMKDNIETFEGYTFALVGLYRQALEKCQDMKALVRTEYDAMLRSKDEIIRELQEKLEAAKEIAGRTEAIEQKYKTIIADDELVKKDLENQLERAHIEMEEKTAEWESRYSALESVCSTLRSSESEAKAMVGSFMKENTSLKEEIQTKKDEHQKERAELKVKIRELEATKEESEGKLALIQRDFTEQKQQFEIFKATTGTELQLAVQKKENELRAEYKVEMDELRRELEKYRELYFKKVNTL